MTDQSSGICGQCGERWHLSTIGSGFDSPTPVHDKQPVSAHNVETYRSKSEADKSIDIEALAKSIEEGRIYGEGPGRLARRAVDVLNRQLIDGKRFECMVLEGSAVRYGQQKIVRFYRIESPES